MKRFMVAVVAFTLCFSLAANAQKTNKLTKAEKKDGWVLLFDGKTTNGWRGYLKQTFPEKGWEVKDGTLYCKAKGGGGDIIYDQKFKDFELSIDWKISQKGNSGIFYRGVEIPNLPIYHSAPEVQVCDNGANTNAEGKYLAGALFDMLPAVPQNAKPYDEWNTIVIKVKDGKVTHTQNGVKVCEYTLNTPEWRELAAKSKFKDEPNFITIADEGYIGVQDHGDDVWFRNIKIKELK